MNPNLIYPRSGDRQTVYLKNVVSDSNIEVGDFTIYNDFVNDPRDFEKNNVLYRYPINGDRLKIGRFCSIACGAKFLFTSGNHTLRSLSTYTFPIFFDEWNLDKSRICEAWDNKGDIELGNDVWVGYEAVIMSGVKIGSGAIIGTRAVVTKDVPPYTVAAGVPAKPIRRRFDDSTIETLEKLRWWDWRDEKLAAAIDAIQTGNIKQLVEIDRLFDRSFLSFREAHRPRQHPCTTLTEIIPQHRLQRIACIDVFVGLIAGIYPCDLACYLEWCGEFTVSQYPSDLGTRYLLRLPCLEVDGLLIIAYLDDVLPSVKGH